MVKEGHKRSEIDRFIKIKREIRRKVKKSPAQLALCDEVVYFNKLALSNLEPKV